MIIYWKEDKKETEGEPGGTGPSISSTRAQEGTEEMEWGPQVEQKEAQRAKLWASPLRDLEQKRK